MIALKLLFRHTSFLLLAGLLAFTGSDRKPYPTDYFRPPVNGQMYLSGTFGELRSNHFHSGIDIKGGIGVPLYAVADGYISRIKVEAGGYGNVLYINHPNGYTSVYAHMNAFTPEVAAYVKRIQYDQESFHVDLYPEAGRFTFRKGERIGEMGTTGYSFGPHLHFEIRDSRTEKPINPLLFGFQIADKTQPRMHQIKVYELNERHETERSRVLSLRAAHGGYGLPGDTIEVSSDRVGFGLKVYDHMDGIRNWNGIYQLDIYLEDSLIYNFEMETFSFDERRYLNAHLDFAEQQINKAYFNRCYRLPGNWLSIYKKKVDDGVVRPSTQRAKKVHMVASDAAGNSSHVTFWVKQHNRAVAPVAERSRYDYLLPYNQESVIDNGNIRLHFPRGAFYEDCYLQYQLVSDHSANVYSAVHHLHHPTTPVHLYYDLAIRPDVFPESLRERAFIAYCNDENAVINYGGTWRDGMLHTQVRTFGDFCIMVDEVPPTITPVNIKADMRGQSRMDFKISDNYGSGGQAKGLQYRATIDGRWILLEHDAKNSRLTHRFDDKLPAGPHQLRVTLTDAVGNETIFEHDFIR